MIERCDLKKTVTPIIMSEILPGTELEERSEVIDDSYQVTALELSYGISLAS